MLMCDMLKYSVRAAKAHMWQKHKVYGYIGTIRIFVIVLLSEMSL